VEIDAVAGRYEGSTIVVDDAFGVVSEDDAAITIDGTAIFYPAEVGWYAVAALAGFLVFAITLLLRLIVLGCARWWGKAPDLDQEFNEQWAARRGEDAEYDLEDERPRRRFARRAVRYRWFANLTDDIDWATSSAVVTTLSLVVGIVAGRLWEASPTGVLARLTGLASVAIAAAWVGLVWLVREAKDSAGLRRTIGMAWDVTAFFPRRFHPLAPPCYAEQSVMDIRDRIIRIRNHEDAGTLGGPVPADKGRLVIIAHSEGTLITAAALMSLQDQPQTSAGVHPAPGHPDPSGTELDGICWITCGCMLRQLFSRAWPDQLPLADLAQLKERLGDDLRPGSEGVFSLPRPGRLARWINFGRYTDYLGGRVFADIQKKPTESHRRPERDPEGRRDDLFFWDPTRRWRYQGQAEHARMWTHSFDYESDAEDPRFREHVEAVVRALEEPARPQLLVRPTYKPAIPD
jgi:hypothetical protein